MLPPRSPAAAHPSTTAARLNRHHTGWPGPPQQFPSDEFLLRDTILDCTFAEIGRRCQRPLTPLLLRHHATAPASRDAKPFVPRSSAHPTGALNARTAADTTALAWSSTFASSATARSPGRDRQRGGNLKHAAHYQILSPTGAGSCDATRDSDTCRLKVYGPATRTPQSPRPATPSRCPQVPFASLRARLSDISHSDGTHRILHGGERH